MLNEAQHEAKRAARSKWMERLAKLGYAAKGAVYLSVGLLAINLAFLDGGAATGSKGALRAIAEQPFGQILLFLTALGLLAYAIYRIVGAVVNPGGKHGAKAAVKRVGLGISGLIHGGLALFAFSILFGWGTGGGDTRQTLTAKALAAPGGPWLVGLAGAAVIGAGLWQLYKAYEAKTFEHMDTARMTHKQRLWAERLGRIGFAARGVVFGLIGIFLIQAALQYDASEAGGMGMALREIASASYGWILLGIVAIGLTGYAIYCFFKARHFDLTGRHSLAHA